MAKKVNDSFGYTIDGDQLGKMVVSVLKQAKTIQSKLHTVLVSTSVHAVVHGNVTYLNMLIDGLGGGFRKQAMLAWAEAKGPVTYSKGDKKSKDEAARKGKLVFDKAKADSAMAEYTKDAAAYVKDLMSVNFGDFTTEPEYQGFILADKAYALLAQAEKVAKGDNATHEKTNLEGLAALRAAISGIFNKQGTKEQKAA